MLQLLLLPQPLLSLAYLAAVRAEIVQPSFVPVLVLTAVPLGVALGAIVNLRSGYASRRHNWFVLALGLIEIAWGVFALALVGFAIGLRSG